MINVLVVDDSQLIRNILAEILNAEKDINVVGMAADPLEARDMIKRLKPDVITLDVEMPKMDGVSFLKNLMRLHPMPVVMISTLTEKGTDITLQALALGAVDYVAKPSANGNGLVALANEIVSKVRVAASANIGNARGSSTTAVRPPVAGGFFPKSGFVIAIGASTGGVEAIRDVLMSLPENCPPVLVVQHIPALFSRSYARRIDKECLPTIHEASHMQAIEAGSVYIAPGDQHLSIKRSDGQLYCILSQSDKVSGHRPSVDVLFSSIARVMGGKCVAALLTGMGSDGAKGLLQLKKQGCHTIAQDEASSVVWGMPGVAVSMQAHCEQLPLRKVATKLLEKTSRPGGSSVRAG
jgi:two-component system chemotaxis response regulator CheB